MIKDEAMIYIFATVTVVDWGFLLGGLALCFLAGSVPFGFIVGKLNGIDIRHKGSGNIGATNVLRALGKKWGYSVFALDLAKGFLPLWLMRILYLNQNTLHESFFTSSSAYLVLGGVLVILGHNFCPWLGFKGGKGIASSAGVLIALVPLSFMICLAGWMITFFTTRYVSIASLMTCFLLPASSLVFYFEELPLVIMAFILGLMGTWRHRSNIKNLLNGTETRFDKKKKKASDNEAATQTIEKTGKEK
ncbi:MAG: glycerol-3-phosphate 1-O-acyltransferase PlsY [Verrucomicrobiota bacterium]